TTRGIARDGFVLGPANTLLWRNIVSVFLITRRKKTGQSKILLASVLIVSQHHPIPLFNEEDSVRTIWEIPARLQLRRGNSVLHAAFSGFWSALFPLSVAVYRFVACHLCDSDVCRHSGLPSLLQSSLVQDEPCLPIPDGGRGPDVSAERGFVVGGAPPRPSPQL